MDDMIVMERQGRVATLTIDRPPLNILDLATIRQLRGLLRDLETDSQLQVLVLKGGGERAFSAGVAVEDHTPDKVAAMLEDFHAVLVALMNLPAVVIAAVQGHCLGGGMELASACDLILATDDSRFSQPEIKLGCFPPMAAAFYPRILGSKRTFDLLLTGRTMKTEEAERMGLISRVVPRQEMSRAIDDLVGEISAHSTAITRLTKKAILASRNGTFEESLAQCERLYHGELAATHDMREGLNAFMEKRQPRWSHR